MGMDVAVTSEGNETTLVSPYHPDFPAGAREIGGGWDRERRIWRFDRRDEDRVRDLARVYFGVDGTEPADDLVTVRVSLEGREHSDAARFAGREIARRRARDEPVRLPKDVVVVSGMLKRHGGSVKNPRVEAEDVIVEIRDLPRGALSIEKPESYELVGAAAPTVEALQAERERLVSRIAEIDAQLAAARGV